MTIKCPNCGKKNGSHTQANTSGIGLSTCNAERIEWCVPCLKELLDG